MDKICIRLATLFLMISFLGLYQPLHAASTNFNRALDYLAERF
jgi:hypothetical protein